MKRAFFRRKKVLSHGDQLFPRPKNPCFFRRPFFPPEKTLISGERSKCYTEKEAITLKHSFSGTKNP
jgi:hypothetical protein